MESSLDFSGIDSFIGDLKVEKSQFQATERRAYTNVLLQGEAIAKSVVPRVTGQLFAGITHSPLVGTAEGYTGTVGDAIVYGPMVNYGAPAGFPINYRNGRRTKNGRTRPYVAHSKGRKAKPFLDPTLAEHQAELMRPIEVEADRLVARLAKGG